MKKLLKIHLALLLIVVFLVPILVIQSTVTASAAAAPELTKTKLELAGIGKAYDLNIKNKVAKSKYKWTTSNKAVATVASNGLVTAVGKGKATIKCKITYPTKKTLTLSCSVTVTIPATEIAVSNAPLVNGVYQLTLGSRYDFETSLTPENTTDTTYWYIDGGDKDCIIMEDPEEGVVTANKIGTVSLKVKAAKTSSKADADKSSVWASVLIKVVEPTATVKSVEITNSNQILVVFDSPIQMNTVIGANNKLTDNIVFMALTNDKNLPSKDPGALTPTLSADMRTLTITTENMLEGKYRISITSGVITTSGIGLEDKNIDISYKDVEPPYFTNVVLDESGVIATINFSEPIDFTNFNVSDATLKSTSTGAASQSTLYILNNKANYVPSKDKKSLSINLSGIAATDFDKAFTVIMYGIKDLSGNVPTKAYLLIDLYTDKSLKPQAKLLTLDRTSYYTITATFDRAIQRGGEGYITIDGTVALGSVDTENSKKVNYTLYETQALFTGFKNVSISNWNSYNVVPTDTTGKTPVLRVVNFDVDKIPPILTTYEYDEKTEVLTLVYNENVNLANLGGIFNAKYVTPTQTIKDNNSITYTMVTHTDGNNVIKIKLSNMTVVGQYTFSLSQGFAEDAFKNKAVSQVITINSLKGATELPGPHTITQSPTNPSHIILEFTNKLDVTSAQNVNNYYIAGVVITSAEVTTNTDTGATVKLTVLDGSIDYGIQRLFKITGVMGHDGSYGAITNYEKYIVLKDNKKPSFTGQIVYNNSARYIALYFSETVQGNLIVNVTQTYSNSAVQIPNNVTIAGNIVYINLTTTPQNGSWLKIDILSNGLTDVSGNAVEFNATSYGTVANY